MGLLLQSHRKLNGQHYRVSAIKIDPYVCYANENLSNFLIGILTRALAICLHMNTEKCTLQKTKSPVLTNTLKRYVLNDGTETDLDLGNYERFLGIDLTRAHSITTGQVYAEVISREERGGYLGQTVQIVPHITDHIIERINEAAQG